MQVIRNSYSIAEVYIKMYGDMAEQRAEDTMYYYINQDDVKQAAIWLSVTAALSDLKNVYRGSTIN